MTSLYVNVYLGQTRAAGWIRKLEEFGFGEMCVRGELPPRRHPWAFDNGAFKDWKAGRAFDVDAYERDLAWLDLRQNVSPDFIVVPDIVAGGMNSLHFSNAWRPRLLRYKVPLYIPVQDGMPFDIVPGLARAYDGLFVGGTVEWKLRTAETWIRRAHAHGMKCHVGQMGTENRARAAIRWGADSIDSALPLWADANLRRFLRGLRPAASRELALGESREGAA